MQQHNSIFELNWEQDFPDNPILPSHASLIETDPLDSLVFTENILHRKNHHASKAIWLHTFDRYIYEYFCLAMQKNRGAKTEFALPCTANIDTKIASYFSSSKKRRKQLPVNLSTLVSVKEADIPASVSTKYISDKFALPAYLNCLCRSLITSKGATAQESSLFFDGLMYKEKEAPGIVPAFSMEDYIVHEMITGIGLSIEIASVLLEFEDPDLRKRAFSSFAESALPILVRSHLFFTRNTVARHYFQEIQLEENIRKYQWNRIVQPDVFGEQDWRFVTDKALLHTQILARDVTFRVYDRSDGHNSQEITQLYFSVPYDNIAVDNSQLSSALLHIEQLISKVHTPVNLLDYTKNPTHGLAVFCHPSHKNVDYYLDQLSRMDGNDTVKPPRCRSDADKVFSMVHKAVREAICSVQN